MSPTIASDDLRRTFLHLQGLSGAPGRKIDTDGCRALVQDIGFVQVDSINTVARAHHQILFSRNQTYRPDQLTRLLEVRRDLFENWTHDASCIPVEFYPLWRHRFARERERMTARWTNWHGHDFKDELDRVLARIRNHGPAGTRDFDRNGPRKEPGWWNWHPGKAALEYLWRTGEIAVTRRENFAKIYDLAERVIPPEHFNREIPHDTFVDAVCDGALHRLGVATSGEIAAFFDLVTPAEAADWCARNAGGQIRRVNVEGHSDRREAFARADIDKLLADVPDPPKRLRVLSPFDPVLRDRKRAERLFDFRYRIEVFVPAPKRVYGYYVFPLLEGDRIVGRIDMICRRADGNLVVTALWPERGVRFGAGRMDRLEAELTRMARFTGMEKLVFEDGWRREPA
ncbi:winged helix-turn-helix domain-containing protein [Stappia sp. ES.058]|uniref:winged helix-turn-helix domain-containing protein n=1 Tax=Stappia sp. ES.058 TaxID=1881061 RepID=UPI00087D22CC|nr:crosslink repair DNA glycosylase YcaQ family protein [Stappia sp. ES.058]SDU39047.1 hypothetical protein SAMN05428979_3413 [Stappia sp. ES.058]